ncbi:MAG: lipopolysaccharide biosynthesis protein, partial [Gemmatimonadetes bacterium]|nr:lipopolysaccharide biosynthesis protein [Gemmatimonadota bacterium]
MTRSTTRVARHAATYAMGSVIGGITRAVLLPVIARTLAPAEYGVLNLLLSTVNLLHLVFELGLVTALIKFHNETDDLQERHRLRSVVFLFLPLLDVAMAVPLILGREFLSQALFGTPVHAALCAIAVMIAFSAAQFQLFLAHLRADDRSSEFVLFMVMKGAVSLGVTLWLVFALDLGLKGFLLGNLAGPAAVGLIALPFWLLRSGVDLSGAAARARGLLRFGIPLVPAALGLWALGHLDVWLLRVFADLQAVGVYGFGSEICLPIGLLLTSIYLAWPSFAFSRAREPGGPEDIARTFRHLFVVLTGGALAVAMLRREALAVIGTAEYAPSAAVIPVLALATVVYGAAQAFTSGLQIAGDTRRLPLLVLVAVLLNAGLNALLIPSYREVGAAWATVATNVAYSVLALRE